MAVTHALAMRAAGNLNRSDQIPQQDSNALTFARLTKAFAGQLEALGKLRPGGEQRVLVKHEHGLRQRRRKGRLNSLLSVVHRKASMTRCIDGGLRFFTLNGRHPRARYARCRKSEPERHLVHLRDAGVNGAQCQPVRDRGSGQANGPGRATWRGGAPSSERDYFSLPA
jgi:hypothetical protein